jgi:stearoyl-CoA desaturase (delta-9 desaturase)
MILKYQQILKFFLICILSLAGVSSYIYDGGSIDKFLFYYFIFFLISQTAKVGYHRWLSHGMIDPGPVGRSVFLWCIISGALVRPLHYVIGHRIHHKYSDTDKDPHPTKIGFWNNLIGNFNEVTSVTVGVKDIYRKKDVMFVNEHYYKLYFLHLILLSLIDIHLLFLSFLLLNFRFFMNVAIFNYFTHGGKKIAQPVNLPAWGMWIVGTPGEHLHKNHHDCPQQANYGTISKWNFDLTYHILKKLTKVNDK